MRCAIERVRAGRIVSTASSTGVGRDHRGPGGCRHRRQGGHCGHRGGLRGRFGPNFPAAGQFAVALPVSSSVIAILKVPSTITTHARADQQRGWILDVTFEGVLSPAIDLVATLVLSRPCRRTSGHFRAAARRRRPARRGARRPMKLDELTGSLGPGRDLADHAFGEAAIRFRTAKAMRPVGRVPGSSGLIRRQLWARSRCSVPRRAGTRISLIARGRRRRD